MANTNINLRKLTGLHYYTGKYSSRYNVANLMGCTYNEAKVFIDIMQAAMLMTLIDRGTLQLDMVTLTIGLDSSDRLIIKKRTNPYLDNLLEHDEDPKGFGQFLLAHHFKRLRLIKDNLLKRKYGKLQETND